MTLFEGIILGLVQGLTEFLPVSSSGHLAILQYFFGIDGDRILSFAVLLHLGTLLSLFAVYYKDLWLLILELGMVIKDLFSGRGLRMEDNEIRKLGVMIIVATIPTAIAGLLFNDFFTGLYSSIRAISVCLIITGTILWSAERMSGRKGKRIGSMKVRDAVLVGIFQSLAITPGISRSGATIVGGLFAGFDKDLAVRFAFLISVPSILGAAIIESPEAFSQGMDKDLLVPVMAGIAVAAISGFAAIKTMIRIVSGKKLYIFSFYTWAVGIFILVYSLIV